MVPARSGPGQRGAAILVGHVDSVRGPAVFSRLHPLRKNDRIAITRADRRTITFRVTAVRHYPKNRFPAATVYAQPGDVTCAAARSSCR